MCQVQQLTVKMGVSLMRNSAHAFWDGLGRLAMVRRPSVKMEDRSISQRKCKCNAQGNAISESAEEKTYWEGDFYEACRGAAVDCGALSLILTCRCTDECSGDLMSKWWSP